MIFEGSRYEFTDVEYFPAKSGGLRQTLSPSATPPTVKSFTYDLYFCVDGDRIDLLAARFLGDAEQWWVIADVNPHWIYFDYLPAGLGLRIPHGIPTR